MTARLARRGINCQFDSSWTPRRLAGKVPHCIATHGVAASRSGPGSSGVRVRCAAHDSSILAGTALALILTAAATASAAPQDRMPSRRRNRPRAITARRAACPSRRRRWTTASASAARCRHRGDGGSQPRRDTRTPLAPAGNERRAERQQPRQPAPRPRRRPCRAGRRAPRRACRRAAAAPQPVAAPPPLPRPSPQPCRCAERAARRRRAVQPRRARTPGRRRRRAERRERGRRRQQAARDHRQQAVRPHDRAQDRARRDRRALPEEPQLPAAVGRAAARRASAPRTRSTICATIDADGLDPKDYPMPKLNVGSAEAQAEAELKFTETLLTYARHAMTGRVHFSRVSPNIEYKLAFDADDVLKKIAASNDLSSDARTRSTRSSRPTRRSRPSSRSCATQPPTASRPASRTARCCATPATARARETVMTDPRVPLLRERLGLPAEPNTNYNARARRWRSRKFQKANGIQVTGQLNGRDHRGAEPAEPRQAARRHARHHGALALDAARPRHDPRHAQHPGLSPARLQQRRAGLADARRGRQADAGRRRC